MTHEIPEQPGEAGWYTDPDGNYQHQQYWDGERWTGDYRRDPATLPERRGWRQAVRTWIVTIVAIVGGFLAGIAAVVVFSQLSSGAALGPTVAPIRGLVHLGTWALVGVFIYRVGRQFMRTNG